MSPARSAEGAGRLARLADTARGNAAGIHATCFVLGDRGVLVEGPGGAGKSALARAALDQCRRFARLVADDRVLLDGQGGRWIARAPAPLRGLLAVRGREIERVPHLPACVIDLCLVAGEDRDGAIRLPEGGPQVWLAFIEGLRCDGR